MKDIKNEKDLLKLYQDRDDLCEYEQGVRDTLETLIDFEDDKPTMDSFIEGCVRIYNKNRFPTKKSAFKIIDMRRICCMKGITKSLVKKLSDILWFYTDFSCSIYHLEEIAKNNGKIKLNDKNLKEIKKLLKFCKNNKIDVFYYK